MRTAELNFAEHIRRTVTLKSDRVQKSKLGQFMTPVSVARFMADMFPPSSNPNCHLLDAGAGVGALSCAFLDRWMAGGFGFKSVETTAYEVDSTLRGHLSQQMAVYSYAKTNVIAGDYIELATAEGLVPRSYTQADLTALRATGCDHTFVDVQTGVGKYVQWLAK